MKNVIEGNRALNACISHENFFLGHFMPAVIHPGVARFLSTNNTKSDKTIHTMVDRMCAGEFQGTYWKMLAAGQLDIDTDRLRNEMLRSDRSHKALYCVVLNAHTGWDTARVPGDRTPSHLFHIERLRRWFPDAAYVHTTRDPRAIVTSQIRRLVARRPDPDPNTLANRAYARFITLHITTMWMRAARVHNLHSAALGERYYLSRYEDLVTQPEQAVERIAATLSVDAEDSMLNPPQVDSSYDSAARSGFASDNTESWREHLAPKLERMVIRICGREMERLGYRTSTAG